MDNQVARYHTITIKDTSSPEMNKTKSESPSSIGEAANHLDKPNQKAHSMKRKGDPDLFSDNIPAPASTRAAPSIMSNADSATTSAGSNQDEYNNNNYSGNDTADDADLDAERGRDSFDGVNGDGTQSNDNDVNGGNLENGNPNKRPRTQEEKKLDRILANRRSARKSRERRKQLQENLEKSVLLLTRQNEELTRENDTLKQELRVLISVFQEKQRSHGLSSIPAPGLSGVGIGVGGNGLAAFPGASAATDLRHHQLQQQLSMANAAAAGGNLGAAATMFQNARNHPNPSNPTFNPAVLAAAMQQQQAQQQTHQQNQQQKSVHHPGPVAGQAPAAQPQSRPNNVQDFLFSAQAAAAAGLYNQHQNPVSSRLNTQNGALFSASTGQQPQQQNQGGGTNV